MKWCLHIGQQMPCWQKVAGGPFWPCFACLKLGDAGRTPAKKGRCWKKPPGCIFDFRAKSSWEDFFMYIKKSSQSESTSKTIYSYYDLSLPSYLQTPQCKSSKSLIDFKWSFPERDKTERLISGAGASLWISVAVAGDFANDSFSYRFIL